MSLAPSERRALAEIEESLRRSDRQLAAKLATFNVLASRRRTPRWKWLSPWRLRLRRIVPLTIAMAALGLLIFTVTVFSHPGRPGNGARGACLIAVTHPCSNGSNGKTPMTRSHQAPPEGVAGPGR